MRISYPFLIAVVALFPTLANAQPPKLLDETLRKLEKDIAAARGLEFKTPVNAKVIARTKDGAKGVQGYYSTKDKTLYLYDDIAGNYERGVLIHEMVHALQDQHFGLAKLHQETFGSDAELALAAFIEGDATFTMIEVLKNDQPKVTAMLDTSLEKAKNLRNAFLYGVGARYVKALKDKGGHASKVSEDQKERSYQVMTSWDEYMGASAAAFQERRGLRRMVVLAGSGHIDLGFGIPQRAVQRTGGKAATVHVAPGGDAAKLFAAPPADFVIIVR